MACNLAIAAEQTARGEALCGPSTTCYNHFNRWSKAGVWGCILGVVTKAYDGDVQMLDTSVAHVYQHTAAPIWGGIIAWTVLGED
jgi:transposase